MALSAGLYQTLCGKSGSSAGEGWLELKKELVLLADPSRSWYGNVHLHPCTYPASPPGPAREVCSAPHGAQEPPGRPKKAPESSFRSILGSFLQPLWIVFKRMFDVVYPDCD